MTVMPREDVPTAPVSQEIAPRESGEIAETLLGVIARAASDPRVDVVKMERLLDMQFRLERERREMAFNQAMVRLQPKLPRITKSGAIILKDGSAIAFARYEDICDVVLPLLAEEGFMVSYDSELIQGPGINRLRIWAIFRHIEGHSASSSVYLPTVDDTGAKNAVQGVGSIYKYGMRYAMVQGLNIVTEGDDDDGMQGMMKPISEKQQAELYDLISDSGADEKMFLKLMGVEAVAEIPVRDYLLAKSSLIQKKERDPFRKKKS